MTIELSPHTEALVTALVSQGRYQSAEQAAVAAFELLEQNLDSFPAMPETKPDNAMSIVELFANSPFAEYGIQLEPEREPWAPVDL